MSDQLSNQQNGSVEHSPFFNQDLKQKIALLVIGFFLTGVVGVFLSFYFQSKSSYNNYKLGLIESQRKVARDILDDVNEAMDARVYSAQVVNDCFSFNPTGRVSDDKWGDYVKDMANWNKNYNRRRQQVRSYFGEDLLTRFDLIHVQFLELNKKLNLVKNGSTTEMHSDNVAAISKLNSDISALSYKMIKRIQDDYIAGKLVIKKFDFLDYLFSK